MRSSECAKQYGPYAVLAVGEDGHAESKVIHLTGGNHMQPSGKGGRVYPRDQDARIAWKDFTGGRSMCGEPGVNYGLGMTTPSENVIQRRSRQHCEMIVLQAGDWETVQNYAGQFWSKCHSLLA